MIIERNYANTREGKRLTWQEWFAWYPIYSKAHGFRGAWVFGETVKRKQVWKQNRWQWVYTSAS